MITGLTTNMCAQCNIFDLSLHGFLKALYALVPCLKLVHGTLVDSQIVLLRKVGSLHPLPDKRYYFCFAIFECVF